MAYHMFILMAENYTNCISGNVKRSFEQKLKKGGILGSSPLGYLNTVGDDGRTTVIFDPDRSFLIKKLFEEYSTGLQSVKSLELWAKDNRLTTKKGNKLTKNYINAILKNRFYYGVMEVKGTQYPHIYPHLISKTLFDKCQDILIDKCQDILNGRKRESTSGNHDNPFLFRGLVRCKKCGRLYSPDLKKGKSSYLRAMPKAGCDCRGNHIREADVVEEVKKAFCSMQMTAEHKASILDTLHNTHESRKAASTQEIPSLQRQYTKVKDRLSILIDALLDKSITKDEYDKKKLELETEKANIKTRMKNVDIADDNLTISLEGLLDFANDALDIFECSRIEEKRKIINMFFSDLEIEGKNVVISTRKPFDLLVNGSSCLMWRERRGYVLASQHSYNGI